MERYLGNAGHRGQRLLVPPHLRLHVAGAGYAHPRPFVVQQTAEQAAALRPHDERRRQLALTGERDGGAWLAVAAVPVYTRYGSRRSRMRNAQQTPHGSESVEDDGKVGGRESQSDSEREKEKERKEERGKHQE